MGTIAQSELDAHQALEYRYYMDKLESGVEQSGKLGRLIDQAAGEAMAFIQADKQQADTEDEYLKEFTAQRIKIIIQLVEMQIEIARKVTSQYRDIVEDVAAQTKDRTPAASENIESFRHDKVSTLSQSATERLREVRETGTALLIEQGGVSKETAESVIGEVIRLQVGIVSDSSN